MQASTAQDPRPGDSTSFSREKRERYAWSELAPRLVDPTRLAIMEALLRLEQPLTAADLAPMLGASLELARYHCRALVKAGVLEIVELRLPPGSSRDESAFDFPQPPQEQSSEPGPAY
jgi:hypothetical protein